MSFGHACLACIGFPGKNTMAPAKKPKVDARKHAVQKFSASAAAQLKPGEHIVFAPHPGLRLEASATRKTWTYSARGWGGGIELTATRGMAWRRRRVTPSDSPNRASGSRPRG